MCESHRRSGEWLQHPGRHQSVRVKRAAVADGGSPSCSSSADSAASRVGSGVVAADAAGRESAGPMRRGRPDRYAQ